MFTFELKFEAEQLFTTLHRRENYQMVGFSNSSFPLKSYLILQRTWKEDTATAGPIWIEWNGNLSQTPIQRATLSFRKFTLSFNTMRIRVDLSGISLELKVLSALEQILGDRLEILPLSPVGVLLKA